MTFQNQQINAYNWLADMYNDDYYPKSAVDKVKAVLLEVCQNIEQQSPKTLDELYAITNQGVDKINDLQDDFGDESEIETVARDCIGMDFDFIAKAYGFEDADVEELIANRDW